MRTHALYLTRMAGAQWLQGHHEQACGTAHQALDLTDQISSQRTAGPLQGLLATMASPEALPAGRTGPSRTDRRRRLTRAGGSGRVR